MKPPANKVGRDLEKAKALKAKQALLSHLCDGVSEDAVMTKYELDACVAKNKKVIELRCKEFDKYGRLLVEVPLGSGSGSGSGAETITVNEWMVQKGYGYVYNGGAKNTAFATTAVTPTK
jgi:hypothetical protein